MYEKIDFINAELRHETELRLRKVLAAMRRHAVSGALLLADNADIYYLSGRFYRGYIYLDSEENPDGTLRSLYFVMRPDSFKPSPDVVSIRKPENIPAELERLGLPMPSSIGLEQDSLSYAEVTRLAAVFKGVDVFNASGILREARMTKTPYEQKLMREDGLRQVAVYSRVPSLYKRDMTDLELQVEIERELRLAGNLGCSRVAGRLMEINMGSVVSGENADVPSPYEFAMGGAGQDESLPGGADGMTMKNGTTVMVDMNGNFNGYQTDLTRVWRVGEISPLAQKAHECSRRILRALEKMAVPGVEIRLLYEKAMEIASGEGLEHYFMGHRQQSGFIGHGVGIELNEQPAIAPRSRETVRECMTLAIEPKFVIPGVGAVGVENTYIVKPDGLENITPAPEEIGELI